MFKALPLAKLPLPIPLSRYTMSQSQQSEDFSSSIYDSDLENLAYLTPDLSGSQQKFDSFDPEFLRPAPPPSIPSSLTRVGPDRRKAYVLYDEMVHTDWVDWWLETDFGKKSKIRWDSNHQSDTWKQFHQVANGSDGAPKVMCKRCGQILEHPYTLRQGGTTRHGTSTMMKHLKTAGCLKAARNSVQKSDITKFMRDTVGAIILPYILRDIILILMGNRDMNLLQIKDSPKRPGKRSF